MEEPHMSSMNLSQSPKPTRGILVPKVLGELLDQRKWTSTLEFNIAVDINP
jgi:hypothetical protein